MTDLYAIMGFLEKFQAIERKDYYPLNGRGDTDAEHSYSLAMVAWQIIIHDKLPLDVDLVLKYALVHDLVEVYAGDVFTFAGEEARVVKAKREKEALEKLESDPNWHEIAGYIEKYEKREDEESVFIWGLEKILIPASNLMNDCPNKERFDKENPITFKRWQKVMKDRITSSKHLRSYYDWLVGELEKHPEQFAEEVV